MDRHGKEKLSQQSAWSCDEVSVPWGPAVADDASLENSTTGQGWVSQKPAQPPTNTSLALLLKSIMDP